MRKTRRIGIHLSLFCKCGKEFTGSNPRLVQKLLSLHTLSEHYEYITKKDIQMIPGEPVNLGISKSNPHTTKGNSNANKINNDIKKMINWSAVAVC